MKIAISSTGKELSDEVAELFGRCPYFFVAEIEAGKVKKTEALKNKNEDQSSGAGMAVAKFLVENGVTVVVAKTIGPRAIEVLRQFKVEVHNESGKISSIIDKFIAK